MLSRCQAQEVMTGQACIFPVTGDGIGWEAETGSPMGDTRNKKVAPQKGQEADKTTCAHLHLSLCSNKNRMRKM